MIRALHAKQTGQNAWQPATAPTAPAPQIHFNLPGYVDSSSAQAALAPVMDYVAAKVGSMVTQSSSGLGSRIRGAVNLP
jgi:hypothetical protein